MPVGEKRTFRFSVVSGTPINQATVHQSRTHQEPIIMQHPMRSAVAAAITAAVALGLGAPAASAAGHHAEAHSHHVVRHVHVTKFAKHSAHARQTLREIARLDARLAWVTRDRALTGLTDDQKAAVVANAAADSAALSALKDSVLAADGNADLRSVRTSLRQVRPQVYTLALLDLSQAARLQATVDQNATDLAAVTDRDVTAGVASNDQAAAALADAVAKALAVTAKSSNADLRAINADFRAAHQALDTVEEVLTGTDDSTESTDPTGSTGSTDATDPTDDTNPDA
jgi:hypothetical protein